jgi:hypothetical protein
LVGTGGVDGSNESSGFGIYAESINQGPDTVTGYINGNFEVDGTINSGTGAFRIDHPLDPANKYLSHAAVESPDMMNVYNGNAMLDANGEAIIQLPDWFEALNRDFRYQLTALGAPGPNLYVAAEISGNHFKIGGGTPSGKVSWQVTGIRQDPWANTHRVPVEKDKSARERGFYLHPDLNGQPEEKSMLWANQPGLARRLQQNRARVMAQIAKIANSGKP